MLKENCTLVVPLTSSNSVSRLIISTSGTNLAAFKTKTFLSIPSNEGSLTPKRGEKIKVCGSVRQAIVNN